MSKAHYQLGNVLSMTAPVGGVVSGTTYKIGTHVGVAEITADAGASFPLVLIGVHLLTKLAGEAWGEGVAVYWDDTAKKWTTTASGNSKAGTAAVSALSAATTGYVRLNGVGL